MFCRSLALLLLTLSLSISQGFSQKGKDLERRRDASKRQKFGLESVKGDALFTIKNVDITRFPNISVIFTAVNNRNEFIPTLKKEDLLVYENGMARPILSLDIVSAQNRVPIDIVFVIDQTGSMRDMIGTIKENVKSFTDELRSHGFDFRLGLVRFSDVVEWVSVEPTDDIRTFEQWVNDIVTVGGGDIKENALEALSAIGTMNLRPIALRLAVLITDTQAHQAGEDGDGWSHYTYKSIGDFLYEREVRLLTITPRQYSEYHELADLTEGASFPLDSSFSSVIGSLVTDITSLYSLRYQSQSTLAPDSVRIDLRRAEDKSPLTSRKLIAMEPGRRFVFEELQFAPNQATLVSEFIPELERIVRLMHVRPKMEIVIEGHADSTGGVEINQKLSQARADAVKRYLMESGIPMERIKAVGYGATRPIAPNSTEKGRQMNRRIEFLITSK